MTLRGTTYTLPVVVIENTRFYRGINVLETACPTVNALEPFHASFPFVWVSNDSKMAAKYGPCLFSFTPKRGTALRLLDIWSLPVIKMMREQFTASEKEALSYYVGVNPGVKASKFIARGRVPYVQEIKPIGSDMNVALRVFPDATFETSTSGIENGSLRWRGFKWGDGMNEFSRHSLDMFDEEVVRGLYRLIKDTGLDGMYAPMLPSHIHETIALRHVFDEEFIVFTESLATKFDPPERLDVSGGRRKTRRRLIRRRRVRHTRNTRSHIPVTRTRHIQRKV